MLYTYLYNDKNDNNDKHNNIILQVFRVPAQYYTLLVCCNILYHLIHSTTMLHYDYYAVIYYTALYCGTITGTAQPGTALF